MLRVWKLSGEELAAVKEERFGGERTVKELKHLLQQVHGFPVCMQQLVRDGSTVDDIAELEFPDHLQLVLLPATCALTPMVESAFYDACAREQVEAVRSILQTGVRPCRMKDTLMSACLNNRVEIARLIVEADPTTMDYRAWRGGQTALLEAAHKGNHEIVRLLLEAGASKDLANDRGQTALIRSSERGHLEVTRILLKAGAEKDKRDTDDNTALMLAADKGHIEIVRLLVAAGANLDVQNRDSKNTALIQASIKGHVEIARLLVQAGAKLDIKGRHMCKRLPALVCATIEGHIDIVRMLLDTGVNLDLPVAISEAGRHGHGEIVRLLAAAGA